MGARAFLRKRGLPNISVANTKGLLGIGMKRKRKPEEITKMNRKNYGRKDYRIKTVEEILLENKEYLNSITKRRALYINSKRRGRIYCLEDTGAYSIRSRNHLVGSVIGHAQGVVSVI